MKHVVTIKELQQLIPETRSLDGKNFKDMKQLIEFVIHEVERSGLWTYVQYVSGNPSLFVVEQREIKQASKYDMTAEISNHYNPQPAPESGTSYDPHSFMPKSTPNSDKKITKTKQKIEPTSSPEMAPAMPTSDQKLFENTKMPW